uniref:Uncharacterized protein n=1 Tax=Arundo donax TaxID=35708 RepID=A0A0A9ES30_ARUDO
MCLRKRGRYHKRPRYNFAELVCSLHQAGPEIGFKSCYSMKMGTCTARSKWC